MQTGVFLSQSVLAGLSEVARTEIANAIFPTLAEDDDWDVNVVRLTTAEALTYLETCREKSRALLQMLVDSEGELTHRAVRDHFGETAAQLKSAWGGLTKRAKTIAGKKTAKLVEWWQEDDGEWIAYMHPRTVESIRVALNETR